MLGLNDDQLASLTGFTRRAVQALAHLREAWLVADSNSATTIQLAIISLLEGHSLKRARQLCQDVLCAGHDRGGELLDACGLPDDEPEAA